MTCHTRKIPATGSAVQYKEGAHDKNGPQMSHHYIRKASLSNLLAAVFKSHQEIRGNSHQLPKNKKGYHVINCDHQGH